MDTVPFGCYRRDVFDRAGGFDEELVRNQDDEFNLRRSAAAVACGFVPSVVSRYYARTSLRQPARMFYQYGYYKPLVIRKVGAIMTIRGLVSAAFVASLMTSLAIGAVIPAARVVAGAIALAYAATMVTAALGTVRQHGVGCAMGLLAVFPVLHFGYGIGFLVQLVRLPFRGHRLARAADAVPLSR